MTILISTSIAQKAFEGTAEVGVPGAFLVDLLVPVSKHVPSWFPGAEHKKKAA